MIPKRICASRLPWLLCFPFGCIDFAFALWSVGHVLGLGDGSSDEGGGGLAVFRRWLWGVRF